MSEKTFEFTRRPVEAFPALEEDYEDHVANNGETLPHLFASMELMDAVVGAYLGREEYRELDWAAVLAYLDKQLAEEEDLQVRGMILASFVEDLPSRGEPGHGIVDHLGPHLAQASAPSDGAQIPDPRVDRIHSRVRQDCVAVGGLGRTAGLTAWGPGQ